MNHASLMNRTLPWLAAAALSILAVSANAQTNAPLAPRVVTLQRGVGAAALGCTTVARGCCGTRPNWQRAHGAAASR